MSEPGMSEFLAEYYGTNGTTKTASAPESQEDQLVKEAQVELFCKVAAEQKIDLASMNDVQVEQLFRNFVTNTKTAAEGGDDEKKKKDEASKELEEKKAAAAEFARYDFFGRQMAHAYVDELKKIAEAASNDKTAEFPPGGFPFKKKEEGKDEKEPEPKDEKGGKDDKKDEKKEEKKASILASVAKTKKASAIDELAFKEALKKAAAAGIDPEQAASRINAAVTLELLGESTKVASANDVNTAVEIRSLEMLEAARYPVEWAKPTAA